MIHARDFLKNLSDEQHGGIIILRIAFNLIYRKKPLRNIKLSEAFSNARVLKVNVRDLNHFKDLGILYEEELLFLIDAQVPIINLTRIGPI